MPFEKSQIVIALNRFCSLNTAGLIVLIGILNGCASGVSRYQVPGAAADFRAMGITSTEAESQTDAGIARKLDRQPLARFPSSIAMVRVQGANYRSYTSRGYGDGCYTIVTNRDVENEAAFNRIAALPMVSDVQPLNRLVIPDRLRTELDLRGAAANVQADMLLLYTFDTEFETTTKVKPLGLLTLGLFPDRQARVTSTAIAALVDTRNGYVYGLAEATGRESQITNAWNTEDAVDQSRRKAEKQAFDGLVGEIESMWRRVAARFGPDAQSSITPADG